MRAPRRPRRGRPTDRCRTHVFHCRFHRGTVPTQDHGADRFQRTSRDGARSIRGGAVTRRRGARKAPRGRTRAFAPGGDGRYSDRAGRGEGAEAGRAGPSRSPRSRRCRPVPGLSTVHVRRIPGPQAERTSRGRPSDEGFAPAARCPSAARREDKARRPSADGRTVAPESAAPHPHGRGRGALHVAEANYEVS